jgi:hypothetical protein
VSASLRSWKAPQIAEHAVAAHEIFKAQTVYFDFDEYALREDTEAWQGGYPFPAKKLPKKIPRILCPECSAGMKGA